MLIDTNFRNYGLYLPEVNETVGTIQVGHPEIHNFIKDLTNDILFQRYKNSLLSSSDIETRNKYFEVKNTFSQLCDIFIMHYTPDIPWIDNIDIIIIQNKEHINKVPSFSLDSLIDLGLNEMIEPDFKAAAFVENSDITKYKNDTNSNSVSISQCAIMINNPQLIAKNELIGELFHELNHYYMSFNVFYNTTYDFSDPLYFKNHYPEYKYFKDTVETMKKQDVDNNKLFINLSALHNDSNYELLKKHFDDITDATIFAAEVKRVLIYCGYLLNDIEINAHKENIFTDLVYYYKNHNEQLPRTINDTSFLKENKYILIYKRVYEILKHIHNLVTDEIRIAFQIKHGTVFNDLLGYHPVKQEDIEKDNKSSDEDLDVFIQQAELRKAGKRVKGHKKVLSIDRCFRYLTNKCHSMFVDDIRRMVGYLPYVDLSIY